MNCPKCGLKNPDGAVYCMRCGKEMHGPEADQPAAEKFCYRHPKVSTQLSCGRCDRPVCTKCVVLGPAGPRCPDCAKQNIVVRPGAVFHTIKQSFAGIFRGGPFAIYWWLLIAFMLFGGVRGCMSMLPQRHVVPVVNDPERPDSNDSHGE